MTRPVGADPKQARKEKRADTRGRKIGPSYPGGLSGHKFRRRHRLVRPCPTKKQLFSTEALVIAFRYETVTVQGIRGLV
jgi:hypothetical protein